MKAKASTATPAELKRILEAIQGVRTNLPAVPDMYEHWDERLLGAEQALMLALGKAEPFIVTEWLKRTSKAIAEQHATVRQNCGCSGCRYARSIE